MDDLLFSGRSLWTMAHGVALGGGGLLAIGAALFAMLVLRPVSGEDVRDDQARLLGWLLVAIPILLWLAVIVGTYIIFGPYRATPPEGLADLSQYPRALIRSDPGSAWLHSFGMEIKEHVPFIAAMLSTAVAFVGWRFRSRILTDAHLRRASVTLLSICFALVAAVSLLGVFINKVAPLE